MNQEQLPREIFSKDRKKTPTKQKSPHEQGGTSFKIPTLKCTSNRPGATHAARCMRGNEDIMGITHIHERHSPPPRSDLTTHTIISKLQTRNDSTAVVPHQARPARYHSLGKGYEQTQPALTLVQGTVIGLLSKYGMEAPQLNLVQNPQLEESAEPGRGAESYPISCTDLFTHTAPPLPCTPFTQLVHQDTGLRNIHSPKNISKLSLFVGEPDTSPSGKDTGIPTRLSH